MISHARRPGRSARMRSHFGIGLAWGWRIPKATPAQRRCTRRKLRERRVPMEGPGNHLRRSHHRQSSFGTRTVGSRPAAWLPGRGSVVAYLDEDHAPVHHHGRQTPKDQFDFFPDRGRRGGCTPRQDPRLLLPSRGPPVHRRDPHLPLIDRPLRRPSSRACATRSRSSSPSWRSTGSTTSTTCWPSTPMRSTQISGLPFMRPHRRRARLR